MVKGKGKKKKKRWRLWTAEVMPLCSVMGVDYQMMADFCQWLSTGASGAAMAAWG
jgi:hypothetical protein